MTSNKFVILDAMALAYKAYFAFISRPLRTQTGIPTSAVFGFTNQLIKIIEDLKPDYIAVAFDSKEKTFRHEKYDFYKSSRAEIPEDLIPQIQLIKDLISAFNIPIYILPGYEADDIIGTAAKRAEKLNLETVIVTPDKDFIQLVTDKTKIIKPGKSSDELEFITKEKVLTDLGFSPEMMIDYLALVGDQSDDIPGVKGIGEKSAVPLIQLFGSIEEIYNNIDKVESNSTKQKLIAGKENAFISKELATIHTSVPLDFNILESKLLKPDFEKLKNLFIHLEIKSYNRVLRLFEHSEDLIEEIKEVEHTFFDKSKSIYHLVNTIAEAEKLAALLSKSDLFVFDTETDSLDVFELKLAGVSFAVKENEAYFIPINPFVEQNNLFSLDLSDRISSNDFVKIFKQIFENESIKKVCQNGKFDIGVLRSFGINVKNFYFDTMLASYCIDPDQKHGMDELSKKYLAYSPIPLSELIGSKKDPTKIFDVDLQKLSDYSAEDADVTLKLFNLLKKEIESNKLEKVFYEVEVPLASILEDMERAGVNIDKASLNQLSKELEVTMESLTKKIYETAGETFNINSTQQLQKILYDKLKLQSGKKIKTGFSTDARSLEALKGTHEIIDFMLEYRQVAKLKSTYSDSLPNLIHSKTGRVHTSFNQTIASTGRLSSNNPNLQNIPIRTELGKEIRKAFIPRDKNFILLSADYSQIELRIMASICGDETLIKAFKNGEDIHRSTAALVFGVHPDEVNSDMRRKAKEVNFGILYGIGVFGLKTRLGITQYLAKEIIDNYFKTFSKVDAFIKSSIESAKEKGYAETLIGRRRYLRNINSKNFAVRQFEERVAVNMPIQGTAADMIKIAMIKIHKELERRKTKTKMILQVHDELVFDVHKDELNDMRELIKNLMETALPLEVPIAVDTGVGDNWLDAH
ncbi:MAG: DNA polymerase I [Chlorobiaceae bacterium]|nr:DNA polymerase I [Chlorobiaceae bacterium]MBA4308705.1 DNA polymerase I [Chlorobiaceae bacterium]